MNAKLVETTKPVIFGDKTKHQKNLLLVKALLLWLFLIVPNAKAEEEEVTRRGFFGKIKDAYIEGRLTKNEQRIVQRKAEEKARRRQFFEGNVRRLVDGVSKRLRRGPNQLKIYVILGGGLVLWLCHKGSVGCKSGEEN